MTGAVQAGLALLPPDNDSGTVDTTKVLVPRAVLLAHATRLIAAGQKQAGNAIRSGCIGAGDWVPVSRALVELWGLGDGAE